MYKHERPDESGGQRLDGERAAGLLATMRRIRLFEERVGQLARSGDIDGLVHLSIGQEGVAAAVCSQLRDDDHVYSGHRDVEHGFMGATGVVGGTVPIALGSALAARLRGTDAVAVVFFGDGAVQAGHFNETINLATLWRLPLVLVCENNGFAEFTPRSAHTVVERVSDVVAPYGLRGRQRCPGRMGCIRELPRLCSLRRGSVPPRVPDAPGAGPLRG